MKTQITFLDIHLTPITKHMPCLNAALYIHTHFSAFDN